MAAGSHNNVTRAEVYLLGACALALSGAFIENGFLPVPYGFVRVLVLLVTLGLFIRHWRTLRREWVHNLLLLALIAWAFLSALWSLDAALTLQRAVSLLSMYLLGGYIAIRFSLRQQVRFVLGIITFALLMSVAFALLLPQYGIMTGTHAGSWNGILSHKNVLGRLLLVGAVILLYLPPVWLGLKRWQTVALGMLFVLVIVLTRSASAWAILLAFVLLWPCIRLLFSHPFLFIGSAVLLGILALGFALLVLANVPAFAALLGRDPTLTGRTHLWDAALQMIAQSPWLGYGYTATFTPEAPIYHILIWKEAAHAHNGWLDAALDLGLVGVTLLTLSNLQNLWRALYGPQGLQNQGSPYALFALLFVLAFMATSISDTTPLFLRDMTLLLYIIVTLSLTRYLGRSVL